MRISTAIALVAVLISGCGSGDGDDSADTGDTAPPATSGESEALTTEPPAEEEAQSGPEENNVILELDDGTAIETSALCTLQPQEVGSSTILFTATGYSDVGFDVTQFDEDSFGGNASVDLYRTEDFENYELYWGSDSTVGELVLELDGSTIRGTGIFFEGDAQGNFDPFSDEGVRGTLTVDCS